MFFLTLHKVLLVSCNYFKQIIWISFLFVTAGSQKPEILAHKLMFEILLIRDSCSRKINFMRLLINAFLFFLSALGIFGCSGNRKLISRIHAEFGIIKFYVVNASNNNTNAEKVYADVDSNRVKKFYSFYPDRIIMTDERAKNLSYTVTFQELPENYDTRVYHRFSRLDSIVFDQAKTFIDSSKYLNLKWLQGAEGYIIEVNYYHGFPKKKKYLPL